MILALMLAVTVAAEPAPRRETTIPTLSGAPALDGRLDEAQWKQAAVITDFTNAKPVEDSTPSQKTVFYVYRDQTHLYVGIDAFDTEPQKVRATFADRDTIFGDDWAGVLLDPFGDSRHAALLIANPRGVQVDCLESETSDDDCSWDTIFFTGGRLNEHGWSLEMSIPFSSLRLDPDRDTWGFQPGRMIARTAEQMLWSPYRAADGSFLKQMGRMHGMKGIEVPPLVELIPELTARTGTAIDNSGALARSGPPNGLSRGGSGADAGITARISKGGEALDATLNPDFSQVESDTSRVTLNQRFPLSYEEKRPFFLEGRDQFNLPWNVIYTRAIVDPFYGLKVTGREGPTAFALLTAMDQHPTSSTVDPVWDPANYRKQAAYTTVARSTTDISEEATLGFVATDKRVGFADNRLVGPDVTLHLSKSWTTVGQLLFSSTDNPDESGEDGTAAKVRLFHNDRYWHLFSYYEQTDRGFRAEAGFIPRVGYRELGGETSYRLETGRERGLIFVRPGFFARTVESTVNDDRNADFAPYVGINFGHSFIRPGAGFFTERFEHVKYSKHALTLNAGSSWLKWLDTEMSAVAGDEISYFEPANPYLGSIVSANVTATIKPVDRVNIGASYYREIFSKAHSLAPENFKAQGVYDATVARTTTQVFFTQYVSARVVAQWTTIDYKLSLSGLLAYRPGPGTIFYIGYQDAAPGRRAVDTSRDRALFVKMSYLWSS